MAIKGSLKEASLADVIQLLYLGRRTGCLAVADRQNLGYIYFDEGKVAYASLVNRRDRLGDLLIRSGRVTAEQLRDAVDRQATDREHRLGEILLGLGAITRQELDDYMRLQIEEAVYFLFTWTSGTFNFEAGVRPDVQDFVVQINPEWLLLEGARRVDEWSLIEKKIPSFDLIFTVDQARVEAAEAPLSEVERQIIPLLDGTRDVQQLVDETGLNEFGLGQAVYSLITAGFAHRTGSSASTITPRMNDTRVEEHRNLGVAFFRTSMLEEAQREFRRVADLRPTEGSAPFYLGLIALRQGRWSEAGASFRAALDKGGPRPAALHNLAFALEQDGRLDEAEAVWGDAAGRSRDDPRVMLGWAVVALKRGDAEVAIGRLERTRELLGERPRPAAWYWAMTLAQASSEQADLALETARDAVALYPEQPVLANNLAVLLELRGDVAGAEQQLRQALAADASLPQASKNLADLLYRAGRYDEALEGYERAAKLAPDLGDDLYFKLGNIAYKRRDGTRARDCWTRATELNPDHQLARANLDMLGAGA
jgi:tetratricopeptide (TPR) repeat protein